MRLLQQGFLNKTDLLRKPQRGSFSKQPSNAVTVRFSQYGGQSKEDPSKEASMKQPE